MSESTMEGTPHEPTSRTYENADTTRTDVHPQATSQARNIVVTDFDISFGHWVTLLIKVALAAIPAMIILWIIGALFSALIFGLFGGMQGLAG
jgi:hypothetical protein